MPPIGSRHAAVVDRLNELLLRAVAGQAILRCQGSVQLGDLSEPQPDLALLAPRGDYYEQRHPTAADTFLLIEVSETTLRYDLHTKMPLYARHGVPEFWIFDTGERELHVFRSPQGGAYAEIHATRSLGVIPIASLPGVTIDLTSLMR